jgi:hypothetical protein
MAAQQRDDSRAEVWIGPDVDHRRPLLWEEGRELIHHRWQECAHRLNGDHRDDRGLRLPTADSAGIGSPTRALSRLVDGLGYMSRRCTSNAKHSSARSRGRERDRPVCFSIRRSRCRTVLG